jgi:hypothetical protein
MYLVWSPPSSSKLSSNWTNPKKPNKDYSENPNVVPLPKAHHRASESKPVCHKGPSQTFTQGDSTPLLLPPRTVPYVSNIVTLPITREVATCWMSLSKAATLESVPPIRPAESLLPALPIGFSRIDVHCECCAFQKVRTPPASQFKVSTLIPSSATC